jgi:hypothetical protein
MRKDVLLSAAIAVGVLVRGRPGPTITARAEDRPEPPLGGADQEGAYLRQIHERLHPGWVDGFIRISPYKQLGPANSERQTEISLILRWTARSRRLRSSPRPARSSSTPRR